MYRVLEGLSDAPAKGCDSSEDIHCAALHSIFVLEGDIAVLYLKGYGNQHRIAGHFHKVSAHIKGHQIHADLVAHHFFQVLELDSGRLAQLGKLLQTIKLLRLQVLVEGAGAEPLHATPSKAVDFAPHAHLLI